MNKSEEPNRDTSNFVEINKMNMEEQGSIENLSEKTKFYKSKMFLLAMIFVGLFIFVFGYLLFKAGFVLNKVSTEGGIFESLGQMVTGNNALKGEKDGRVNVLLMGMRGEHVVGGGLLADTIMIASIDPINKKASLFSVPRDLYVTVPDRGFKSKINAVYHYGEEAEKDGGMKSMKKIIGEVTGNEIQYALVINFKGFEDLVDSLGGIDLHLEESFIEPLQFKEEHVCDENVYTESSGNVQEKKNEKGKVVASYPLCYNKNLECGGIFQLPAGDIKVDGEKALCYVRSRVTSSDFDRARRQQEVLQSIKTKATSAGTLSDFSKINDILDSLGDNTKTDMRIWEMKRFFEIYQGMGDGLAIGRKVLENSEEGLLYAPEATPETGYILLPRGDNYDKITEAFNNILN
ncbi:LCP family protein [Patescibacteria group bacterium]